MPKLILVRHGQTDYNFQRRYQGQTDNPLNETGLGQAEAVRRHLATFKFDAAYASNLIRAQRTAEIILQDHPSGLTPTPLPLLREASGGQFEGLTWEEITAHFPEEAALWQANKIWHSPPGGETMTELVERVRQALDQIVTEQPGEDRNVLVVAHGGIFGILLCYLMGMDLNRIWQWRIDTCSVTILDLYKEGAILSLFNDTAHLDPAHLEKREPTPTALDEREPEPATEGVA